MRIADVLNPQTSPGDRDRIVASVEARLYGRPKENVGMEVEHKPSPLADMDIEELTELWRRAKPDLDLVDDEIATG